VDLVSLWRFLWPGWDALWPNILASVICGFVAWLWARRHVRRIHRKLDRLHEHLGVEDTPPKSNTTQGPTA
jgi:hypothetical protein